MSFVHGHSRDTGWVVAHLRPPTDAEDGQLTLPLPPSGGGDDHPDTPAPSPADTPAPSPAAGRAVGRRVER